MQNPIYTIGYGNRSMADFISLLRQYEIAYLIDVRSNPYSKYNTPFRKNDLEGHITQAGLTYVFMGDVLGGKPDAQFYTEDGKPNYQLIRQQDFFKEGIARLKTANDKQLKVALMCCELDPRYCHRNRLITPALFNIDIPVVHIDGKGKLLSQQHLEESIAQTGELF